MDITVAGRKLPVSELMLGVRGDNNVESIRFIIPRITSAGVDLSTGIGYAVFRLPSGTDGQVSLTPEVIDDDTVAMTLLVGSQMTSERGRGKLALKISGLESVMWSSEICDTFVVNTIDMPSPQAFSMFRAMSVAPRIAEEETEQPLTVTERTINIPAELQTIAVANDENSETVSIVVPRFFDGQDLSEYDFILHTEMAGNGVDDILFNDQNGQMKSVEDSTVTLTWVLRPPQTSYEGKLSIQLLVQGEEFKWHSLIGELTIAKHISGESVIPSAPSMYEQWIAEMQDLIDKINASASAVDDFNANLPVIQAAESNAQAAAKSASDAAASAEEAKQAAESASQAASGNKGWYANADALRSAHPTAENGAWAIVGDTDTIWVWDSDTSAWVESSPKVDLSGYYTKEQTDDAIDTAVTAKVSYQYKATFDMDSWTPGSGNVTQTATLVPVDGGPAVTSGSTLLACIGTDSTLPQETKDAMSGPAGKIAKSAKTLGDNTITVTLDSAPDVDVEIFFSIKQGVEPAVPPLDPVGADGSGSGMKLLWTNPNPGQAYSTGTVELDLSNYDAVLVTAQYATNDTAIIEPLFLLVGQTGVFFNSYGVGAAPFTYRKATVSKTGVSFAAANVAETLIPYQIFGVKF